MSKAETSEAVGILKEFAERLTGAHQHGVLHMLLDPDTGPVLAMFIMDSEFDPVRITYCPEGLISIHADGHKWHMFSADQLEFIAEKAGEAVALWEEYFHEHPDA